MSPRDLLDGGADQDRLIGQFNAVGGSKGELHLTGAVLGLDRPRRQAQRREVALDRLEQRFNLIGVVLGQQVPPRVDALVVTGGFIDAVEMELHLETSAQPQSSIRQPLMRFGTDPARRQLDRSTSDAVQVTEHPPGAVQPRQHAKRGGVGDHEHVARPHHRGERWAAVGLPEAERVVPAGVLGEQRSRKRDAAAQRVGDLRRVENLAVQQPVLVGERDPNASQPQVANLVFDCGRGVGPVRVPAVFQLRYAVQSSVRQRGSPP